MRFLLSIVILLAALSLNAQNLRSFVGKITYEHINILPAKPSSTTEMYFGNDIVLIYRLEISADEEGRKLNLQMPQSHARYIILSGDSTYYIVEGVDTIFSEWRPVNSTMGKQVRDTAISIQGTLYDCLIERVEKKEMRTNPFDGSLMNVVYYRNSFLSKDLGHNMGRPAGSLERISLFSQEEINIDFRPSLSEQRVKEIEHDASHPFLENWPIYKSQKRIISLKT